MTNRGAGGRARRELRLVQMKPITARAPQAASAGVPLVLIQDARARKVNCDVIVRRRPRRTDECGFDHRRGMRAIVHLGSCAMALRVNLGRRYGVKRRADPKGGELTGRAHAGLFADRRLWNRADRATSPKPSPRQPRREWRRRTPQVLQLPQSSYVRLCERLKSLRRVAYLVDDRA